MTRLNERRRSSDQGRYFGPQRLYKRARAILDREFCVHIGRRALDLDRRTPVDPSNGNEECLAASEFDLLKIF